MSEFEHAKAKDSPSTILTRLVSAESASRPALDSFRRWASGVPCSDGLRDAPGVRRDGCSPSPRRPQRHHTSLFITHSPASSADACRCRGAVCRRPRHDAGIAAHAFARPSVLDGEPRGRLARPPGSDVLLAGWRRPHPRGLFGHGLGSRPRVGYCAASIGGCASGYRELQAHMMPPNQITSLDAANTLLFHAVAHHRRANEFHR